MKNKCKICNAEWSPANLSCPSLAKEHRDIVEMNLRKSMGLFLPKKTLGLNRDVNRAVDYILSIV